MFPFILPLSGQLPHRDKPSDFGIIFGTTRIQDGSTLPGVKLWISGLDIHATSDHRGEFTLTGVPAGRSVVLMATRDGFQLVVRPLTLEKKEIRSIQLELALKELSYEVEVHSDPPTLMDTSAAIGELSFSPAEIAAIPSLGDQDIFRSMQLMPGISGSNESSSGLYVRGGTPDMNLVRFDGFTVYHVDHFFGIFSAFNPAAIDKVTIYKGGFGARYGERLSSVVDIEGAAGEFESLNGRIGASLLAANAGLDIPLGSRANLMLTARKSFQSPIYDKLFDTYNSDEETMGGGWGGGRGGRFGASFDADPDSWFYDLNARLTWNVSSRDVFIASFFNGVDDLDNSRIMDAPPFMADMEVDFQNETIDVTTWGNLAGGLAWHHQWGGDWYSRIEAGISHFFYDRDQSTLMNINRDDVQRNIERDRTESNDVEDMTVRWDNHFHLSDTNSLEWGLQLSHYDIRYDYEYSDMEDGIGLWSRRGGSDTGQMNEMLNTDGQGDLFSIYLQDQLKLFSRLTLTPGIRYSIYSVTGESFWEPRISAILKLTDRISIKGAWGRYHQFVNRLTREDFDQGDREFWALADGVNIPVGESTHLIAGISYETPTFLADLEAYAKDFDGITEYTLRFAPLDGESLDFDDFFYSGTGEARGIELLLQKKAGKFMGWVTYTLGNVEYDIPEYGDEPFAASHDVTHELKLVLSMTHKGWTFGATAVYGSGRPYTEPTGIDTYTITMDQPGPDGETERVVERVIYGEKNGARLPAYTRVDLSAYRDIHLFGAKARIGASIFNLLGRQNVWRMEFEAVEGEIIATNVNYLGFTPNLSLTIYLK